MTATIEENKDISPETSQPQAPVDQRPTTEELVHHAGIPTTLKILKTLRANGALPGTISYVLDDATKEEGNAEVTFLSPVSAGLIATIKQMTAQDRIQLTEVFGGR